MEIFRSAFMEDAKKAIALFGHSPEHNYTYFLSTAEGGQSLFLKSKEGYGVLSNYRELAREVVMISEALSPRENQVEVLKEALDTCFSSFPVKKFVVEQDDLLKSETLGMLKENGYRALNTRYTLYWPVFVMSKWTGSALPGEDWKKMRNVRNRFYSEHVVEAVDTKTVEKGLLKQIVHDWVERRKLLSLGADRKDSNMAYYSRYMDLIDLGFEGMKFAKTLIVDGEPCTITAGWEIPNSENSYYSGIGISNYRHDGMGEIANLDDLNRLLEMGYRTVDFGGSPMPLLQFKLKFRPHFVYATHTYAIAKK